MTRHLARFALLVIFALVLFCSGFSNKAKRTLRMMTYNIQGPLIVVADLNDTPDGNALASDHVPVVAELEIQ